MVEIISKRYVALTETENSKLSRLLTPDYLRSVLRKPDDNLKVEYCSRTENAYMVLTVLPVEWHADGTVAVVMQVVQDIGQKVELENMANTDSLTGLFNERYFSRFLNICEAKKLPFVLYYLDLDRFKPVNDTYGHVTGDEVLRLVAEQLKRTFGNMQAFLARYGGDEFVVIVKGKTQDEMDVIIHQTQENVNAIAWGADTPWQLSISIGCAMRGEQGKQKSHELLALADERMYRQKKGIQDR